MAGKPQISPIRRAAALGAYAAGMPKPKAAAFAGVAASTIDRLRAEFPGVGADDFAGILAAWEAKFETPETSAARRAKSAEDSAQARRIADLETRLAAALAIREGVLGLAAQPLRPRKLAAPPAADDLSGLTWVIPLADYHLGKRFDRSVVKGLMDYSVTIARARIARQFQASARLMRDHPAPTARICVALLGDNANGALREDDLQENEIPPMQQARVVAEAAAAGIDLLRDMFPGVPLSVYGLPGNHGRTTRKPPSVNVGENWDILAATLLEWRYRGDPGVEIHVADTPDLVIDIHGRAVLLTHGDRIGANGGDGQIGPLGPTARGALKMRIQYDSISAYTGAYPALGLALLGHYHYQWTNFKVMVSGAGIGVDEWSLFKLRADPSPPRQWLLGFHPRRWLVEAKHIDVGDPEEGPICAGLAEGAAAEHRVML